MITMYDGMKLALVVLVVGTYLGFFIRLLFYEKITHVLAVVFSTYLFTLQMIMILIAPLVTIIIVLFDGDIRKNEHNLSPIRHWSMHALMIIISPLLGVRYIFRNLPRLYNKLFPALHSVLEDVNIGWKLFVTRNSFDEFKEYQTRDMNAIVSKLVHQN